MAVDPAAAVSRLARAMGPTIDLPRNVLVWMTIDGENWPSGGGARHDPTHE